MIESIVFYLFDKGGLIDIALVYGEFYSIVCV